jgi:hypothetical protein
MHADPSFRVIPVPLPGATAASMAELGDLFEAKQRVDFRNGDLGSAIRRYPRTHWTPFVVCASTRWLPSTRTSSPSLSASVPT